MGLFAGFAEVDITPPVGTHIIGWLRDVVSTAVRDPLFARIAVLGGDDDTVAFVQLDTLSVRWTLTEAIRAAAAARYGYPADRIMVCATHTHAGPAVAHCGEAPRDDRYVEWLVGRIEDAFGAALDARQPAEIGFGSTFVFDVAHNRRVVMRDGTVRSHGRFTDPDALYVEGPIDPELAVIALRDQSGGLLGALANFACHPTHHGSDGTFSAGFPGVFAAAMKARACPVTLYLQGAAGNLHTSNPCGPSLTMSEAGVRLADEAERAISQMTFSSDLALASERTTVSLAYREPTAAEVAGTVRGAQRFVDPAIYDRLMPPLLERIRTRGTQPAEVQAHRLGDHVLVAVPAEYFVELGLRIKTAVHPHHGLVVGYANGMVGYLPHREAFERGGYETTFTLSSRQAPGAGEEIAEAASRVAQALFA